MDAGLVFRARAWSNMDGLKVHISLHDKAETCCRIEQRISYLDLESGDNQPLAAFSAWLAQDFSHMVCKACSRKAMTAFHEAQARAAKARIAQQAQEEHDS